MTASDILHEFSLEDVLLPPSPYDFTNFFLRIFLQNFGSIPYLLGIGLP